METSRVYTSNGIGFTCCWYHCFYYIIHQNIMAEAWFARCPSFSFNESTLGYKGPATLTLVGGFIIYLNTWLVMVQEPLPI